jgi:hypothetical protein
MLLKVLSYDKKGLAIPVVLAFIVLSSAMFIGLRNITISEQTSDYSGRIRIRNEYLAQGYINIILLKIRRLPMEFRDACVWYLGKAYGFDQNGNPGTIESLTEVAKPDGTGLRQEEYLRYFMRQFNFRDGETTLDNKTAYDFSAADGHSFSNNFSCYVELQSSPDKTRDDVIQIRSISIMLYQDRTGGALDTKSLTSTITKVLKLNWFQTN